MTMEMTQKDRFIGLFDNLDFSFDSDYSKSLRDAALTQLQTLDLPSQRHEYWKYTRLNPLYKKALNANATGQAGALDAYAIKGLDAYQVVMVDGFVDRNQSEEIHSETFILCPLSEAKVRYPELVEQYMQGHDERNEFFIHLNTAFHNDGVFIYVAKDHVVERPIHILHLNNADQAIANPRNLVIGERFSKVCIVERFERGDGKGSFCNSFSEFALGEGGVMHYDKVQFLNSENYHIATEEVRQGKSSQFNINTISLQGGLIRNNLNISLDGEQCEANLNGIYLAREKQHVDNHTYVDHKLPHCQSNELYKGILNEQSTGVFNGKVMVRQDAQKTNAFQSNANILLTDDATINSKPELEIYADDVKCSHGSATGKVDEEALFYLQARGISKTDATNLLLYAFAGEVLDKLTNEALSHRINKYIAERYHTTENE